VGKLEELKVTISYSENNIDKEHFHAILLNILKKAELKKKDVNGDETECSIVEG
jgi:hypothetical protein